MGSTRALIAVLLAFSVVAAACGSDDDGDAGSTTEAPSAVTAAPSDVTAAPSDDTATPSDDTDAPSDNTEPEMTEAPAPAEPEVDSVVYSGVTPNAGNWPMQIGVELGFFEDFGLPTEMIFSASSPAALAALIGGSVQFTSVVYGSAILANDVDKDVIMVADGYRGFPFDLIVGKDIETCEDLRGATCGANNPPGIGDALYIEAMIEAGSDGALQYPGDFDLVNVKLEGASSLGALEAGSVQCITSLPPVSALLQNEGYPALYQLELVPRFQNLSFFGVSVLDSWASENPIATRAWLKGYMKSIAWLYDPANKDEAVAILGKNADIDVETAEAAYVWVDRGGYPRDGLIASDIIPRIIEVQRGSAGSRGLPDDFPEDVPGLVDNSYVQQAWDELPDSIKDGVGPFGMLPEIQVPA